MEIVIKFLRKYSVFEVCYLFICVLRGKLIHRNVRLIRFPIQIRNKSRIEFGKNFTTGVGCRLEVEGSSQDDICSLTIGNNVQINDYVHITAYKSVRIGNNVLIASKVYISDVSHGEYTSSDSASPFIVPSARSLHSAPVNIEDNVWLGDGVCVLPGVNVGFGSIVGANAVVTKSIPPLSICVGIPAKVIKVFNEKTGVWEKTDHNE